MEFATGKDSHRIPRSPGSPRAKRSRRAPSTTVRIAASGRWPRPQSLKATQPLFAGGGAPPLPPGRRAVSGCPSSSIRKYRETGGRTAESTAGLLLDFIPDKRELCVTTGLKEVALANTRPAHPSLSHSLHSRGQDGPHGPVLRRDAAPLPPRSRPTPTAQLG